MRWFYPRSSAQFPHVYVMFNDVFATFLCRHKIHILIMKSFSTPLLFLVLFALAACRKKDEYVYPAKNFQVFDNYFLTHFAGYRLYTSTGEINDLSLVQDYATRFSQFFYHPAAAFSFSQYKSFSLVTEDSLVATGIVPAGELKRTGTGTYDIFSGNRLVPVNDTNALFLHIGSYRLHEVVNFPGSAYRYVELQSPAYVIKKVQDTLFLPMIRYIVTSRRDNTVSFSADLLNNVFDPAGAAWLKPFDTLLLQSFDLGLGRRR